MVARRCACNIKGWRTPSCSVPTIAHCDDKTAQAAGADMGRSEGSPLQRVGEVYSLLSMYYYSSRTEEK
jgi:hypothetical protein